MRIYIAGKITGLDNYRDRFDKKQKELENKGHTVINPTGLYDILGDGFSHNEYMKICFSLIDLCDCIYLLANWRDSKGAIMELEHGLRRGIEVRKEEEE